VQSVRERAIRREDSAVQFERLAVPVVVHDASVREVLDPRRARQVVVELTGRLAEAARGLDLLLLVGQEPLGMRPPLVELGLQCERDVVVDLERGHAPRERVPHTVGCDAGEELVAGGCGQSAIGEGVHRMHEVIHEEGKRVGVVDEVRRVPDPELQIEQMLGRCTAGAGRRGRDGRDEVERAAAAPRHHEQRQREGGGCDE
jgi:hypothetical protein